jgi:uncharacterized membrane protein YuzA (DUF378 family)
MSNTRVLNLSSLVLVIVGGVNWGLVAIFGFDPLAPILGGYDSIVTRLVYGAVGLAALRTFHAYLMTPGEDYDHIK